MGVSAKEVNELRKKTGAGLMDCKKALTEADGNIEEAINVLRKKGQKVAELRAGKDANEGVVIASTSADGKEGVAVYISCETDFVAKNDDFVGFAKSIADVALNNKINSLDDLLASDLGGVSVKDKVAEKVGAIGENINVSGFERVEGEHVISYNHAGNKIGVLVGLNKGGSDGIDEIGRDVAMQVAAMNPVALDKSDVSQEVIDRELQIGREKALAEGKPENIVDKIAEGTLNKFYKENTLLNQQYVKDPKKSIAQVLKEVEGDLTVTQFKRLSLGSN